MNKPDVSIKEALLGDYVKDEERTKHLEISYLRKKIKIWLLTLFSLLSILSLIISVWFWLIFKDAIWIWASVIWLVFLLFSVVGFSDTNSKGDQDG